MSVPLYTQIERLIREKVSPALELAERGPGGERNTRHGTSSFASFLLLPLSTTSPCNEANNKTIKQAMDTTCIHTI